MVANKMSINDWRNDIFESDLSPQTKLVAMVLSTFYEEGKNCNPPLIEISEKSSLPIQRVKKALEELQREKYLRITKTSTEVSDGN
jgi:predicted methyltransferase